MIYAVFCLFFLSLKWLRTMVYVEPKTASRTNYLSSGVKIGEKLLASSFLQAVMLLSNEGPQATSWRGRFKQKSNMPNQINSFSPFLPWHAFYRKFKNKLSEFYLRLHVSKLH